MEIDEDEQKPRQGLPTTGRNHHKWAAEKTGTDSDHGDAAPLPFAPHEKDHSPLGDTDQHSDA